MVSESMKMMKAITKEQGGKVELSEGTDFQAIRVAMDMQYKQMPIEEGITCIPEVLDGINVECIFPKELSDNAVILDIHGGAFVYGNLHSSRSYAAALAAESGFRVYTIEYSLAPEHPFPAAPEECFAVYKALVRRYPDCPIVLVGESAGATLALVTALMAKDARMQVPACVVAFAPCTSFADDFPSREENAETDIVVPGSLVQDMIRLYVGEGELKNPYVSPLYGDLKGFPPLKLVADNGEVLADDTREFAKKAKAAGVDVDLRMYDDTMHTFPNLAHFTEESTKELADTVAFIKRNI